MLIRIAIILVFLTVPAQGLALVDDISVNQSFHVRIQQEDNPAGAVEGSFNHAGTETITHELEVLLGEGPSHAFDGEDVFSATGTLDEVSIYRFEA